MVNDKPYIELKNRKDRDRFYAGMTQEQKYAFSSITDNVFTFIEAAAGTGKTIVSCAAMIDLLANDVINKIIYIQKVSQRFLQNGFLPGTMEDKTEALFNPVYDAMETLGFTPYEIQALRAGKLLHLTTDSNLRGMNFERAGVIIDEAENCDYETLKLIFTRCHDDCHVVLIGDSFQKDNRGYHNNDFVKYGKYLSVLGNSISLTKNFRGKFSQLAEDFTL